MNLEAIALRRAEEQLASGTWKTASRREAALEVATPRLCHVPGCVNPLPAGCGNRRTICESCLEKGYAATPCKCCGGRLLAWEIRSVTKARRGICGACRAEMPQTYCQDMSAAHAEMARRRRASRLAERSGT